MLAIAKLVPNLCIPEFFFVKAFFPQGDGLERGDGRGCGASVGSELPDAGDEVRRGGRGAV